MDHTQDLEERAETCDDFHRRRPGEPVGHVPAEGERIRYALRHDRWNPAANRMQEGGDFPGVLGEVCTVVRVFRRDGAGHDTYECLSVPARGRTPRRSWIDLDWWYCVPETVPDTLW